MRNAVALGIVLWISTGCASAQVANFNKLCASVKNIVVVAQNPSKISREAVFITDCKFAFQVGPSSNVSVSLERYASQNEASLELASLRKSFIGFEALEHEDKKSRDTYRNIDPDRFWDQAVAYANKTGAGHFALIRQDRYLMVVLSNDFSAIKKTESLLRKVQFDVPEPEDN